jgi:hypothetical protein
MPVQIRQNVCSCDLGSPQTQPLFSPQRPNAETRHRRPCDDPDAVYVTTVPAFAEYWLSRREPSESGFAPASGRPTGSRANGVGTGRTRQHSSSGRVWALGRWRFLFPADHRPLHFALCAIPLELDLFTANGVLKMDGARRPAMTAVAWSSKRNRCVRHERLWRERSHEAAGHGDSYALGGPQLPPGCGSLASWDRANLMPGTRATIVSNSSRCVARVARQMPFVLGGASNGGPSGATTQEAPTIRASCVAQGLIGSPTCVASACTLVCKYGRATLPRSPRSGRRPRSS